jgi:hypothetical protein
MHTGTYITTFFLGARTKLYLSGDVHFWVYVPRLLSQGHGWVSCRRQVRSDGPGTDRAPGVLGDGWRLQGHPLIDDFIPTLHGKYGICYTHPDKLPGE